MASLTQTAIITRKIIRYTTIGVIAIIILRIGAGVSVKVYQYFFPPPAPPPTIDYSILPALPFPEREVATQLIYLLETPDGKLPEFPEQAKVFIMPKPPRNLRGLEDTLGIVISLGFPSGNPQEVKEPVYKFAHDKVPSTLEINTFTKSFSISYDLISDPSPLNKRPPQVGSAMEKVQKYLSSAGLLGEDIPEGPTPHEFLKTHEFLKVEEEEFVPTVSQSDANAIKVNLYRKDYENLPSFTADPEEGNIWFIISGERAREKQILAGEYRYFPVDEERFGTYPLKTSAEAWEELKAGSAYIANPGKGDLDEITIRRVYLAYYDPGTPFGFFQPIIVFEGDDSFFAYIPAIATAYYGE